MSTETQLPKQAAYRTASSRSCWMNTPPWNRGDAMAAEFRESGGKVEREGGRGRHSSPPCFVVAAPFIIESRSAQ
jgi:hypothetical protein